MRFPRRNGPVLLVRFVIKKQQRKFLPHFYVYDRNGYETATKNPFFTLMRIYSISVAFERYNIKPTGGLNIT